jgi:hypothetical protein
VRFDTYYKAQYWDKVSLAWRDVQRSYATPDACAEAMAHGWTAGTFSDVTWRIMEV